MAPGQYGDLRFCGIGDQFGRYLVATDFNGDGYDELAIGMPEEDVNRASNAGASTS